LKTHRLTFQSLSEHHREGGGESYSQGHGHGDGDGHEDGNGHEDGHDNSHEDGDSEKTASSVIEPSILADKLGYDEYVRHAEEVRTRTEGPQLHVISMDNVQRGFKSQLGALANYVALHNDLMILITKPGEKLRERTDRVADTHLRLERSGTAVIVCGENPLTPLLGLGIDNAGPIPRLRLLEMV